MSRPYKSDRRTEGTQDMPEVLRERYSEGEGLQLVPNSKRAVEDFVVSHLLESGFVHRVTIPEDMDRTAGPRVARADSDSSVQL